ncbi:MAG TPA: ADP-ribosyltransferase [Kofleriaceae bacterium]|nr:ADP-ribosyltransferase [Kofleriaceae bacterium]
MYQSAQSAVEQDLTPGAATAPGGGLDASLQQELLSADRRGPEALEGFLGCLTDGERAAALQYLHETKGNNHVAQALGGSDPAAKKSGLLAGALARHATPPAADIGTTVEAAQAAPATVATSSTKEGIDSLNTEGSYDYRMDKVQQIRNDMVTGSQDYISPDVNPQVIEETKPHLGEGGITNDQMVAIQGYTSQDYLAVNKVLRQPEADPAQTAKLAGYVESIRGGLNNLPSYEGEVFRGTAMSQRIWGMWQQAHAEGGTVSDAAFSSSSKDEQVAEDFLAKTRDPKDASKVPVFCRILSRTGKQVEFLSRTANEAEVLFNTGAKFKIIYIEDGVGADGQPRKEVFLREVVDDPQTDG